MSAAQYKRLLLICEALLRKVELPTETITKYQELRDQILNDETFAPLGATSELGSIGKKDQFEQILKGEIIETQDL